MPSGTEAQDPAVPLTGVSLQKLEALNLARGTVLNSELKSLFSEDVAAQLEAEAHKEEARKLKREKLRALSEKAVNPLRPLKLKWVGAFSDEALREQFLKFDFEYLRTDTIDALINLPFGYQRRCKVNKLGTQIYKLIKFEGFADKENQIRAIKELTILRLAANKPHLLPPDKLFLNEAALLMRFPMHADGREVFRQLDSIAPLSAVSARANILTKMVLAVDDLHRAKLTHLDINPDNFLCSDDWARVFLIDLEYCGTFDSEEEPSEAVTFVGK